MKLNYTITLKSEGYADSIVAKVRSKGLAWIVYRAIANVYDSTAYTVTLK